jgi:hypothetical protein
MNLTELMEYLDVATKNQNLAAENRFLWVLVSAQAVLMFLLAMAL